MSEPLNAVAIPSLDDMQAGANARVHAEITRELGNLRFELASAQAVADGWQARSRAQEAALAQAQRDLLEVRQEAAVHQAVAQSHASELQAAHGALTEAGLPIPKLAADDGGNAETDEAP